MVQNEQSNKGRATRYSRDWGRAGIFMEKIWSLYCNEVFSNKVCPLLSEIVCSTESYKDLQVTQKLICM